MPPPVPSRRFTRRACYSMQYACLSCRKVFKHACAYAVGDGGRPHACPQCGRGLARMGVAFKAPRQGNARAWRKVAYIVGRGLIFHANVGRFPKGMYDLRAHVSRRLHDNESEGQQLARRFKNRPA